MGFPEVPIGELARPVERLVRPIAGHSYRQLGVRLWGEGAYEREVIDGGETRYARLSRVAAGDIVVNKIWARNGSVAVVPTLLEGCYVSGEFPTFQCLPDRLNARWFHWITKGRWFWERCDVEARGTSGKNRIRPERFLTIRIPNPPLAEQHRIVEKLGVLEGHILAARTLRAQSVDATQRFRAAQVAQCTDAENWQRGTLADLILSMDAGWSPQCEGTPAHHGEWGVLRTTSVQWRAFLPEENKALPPGLEPIPALSVEAGDVLVTRAGPRKRVGVVAAVRRTHPRLMISDKLIRLKPDLSKIDARFLELALVSSLSQEHLVQRKTGLADAQLNISQAILLATPVAYPSLAEQRQIVERLDGMQAQVDGLQALQGATAVCLDALLPSILDKALKGEL